ncbi:uncharacterized protein YkwD [Planktotalea frisia]|uniref:Cysteine-rich secretory protein family protein n=2 Tax=Planktotalea frisia TaxID=696762 RepID=A0A1L9NSU1_9RHOB|nr:cysteine-rich secretory protein family protein [Planktotalea frisia]PZX23372.1 uncharacterized protein YkwD [Planktotalea frisia]
MKRAIQRTSIVLAALALSGCIQNTVTRAVTGAVGQTPATTVATQGMAPTATTLRQFPSAITGGDGFQANPNNDASFATLINTVRADANSAPVTYNAQLDAAAQKHSQAMVDDGFFAHENPNTGSSVGDRARAEGYNFTFIAENIAQGHANENQAMNGWINSPGHQSNNIDTRAKEFGLGRVGNTWTLVLGAQ